MGILQVRILEWFLCPPLGDLSNPGVEPTSPALQVDSLLIISHQGSLLGLVPGGDAAVLFPLVSENKRVAGLVLH